MMWKFEEGSCCSLVQCSDGLKGAPSRTESFEVMVWKDNGDLVLSSSASGFASTYSIRRWSVFWSGTTARICEEVGPGVHLEFSSGHGHQQKLLAVPIGAFVQIPAS